MTRAEQRSIEAYPYSEKVMNGIHRSIDIEATQMDREAFIQGYEQSEKDNELTWEDMKTIHHIAETMKEYIDDGIIVPFGRNAETFYEEVLRRFKEGRK